MPILELNNVSYNYVTKYVTVHAVRGVSCRFEKGKLYVLCGASGCGKTTLLSLMAGLDLPGEGEVIYNGQATRGMDLDKHRREHVAVIYQSFNLLPQLTAAENVMLPMELNGVNPAAAREKAGKLTALVGLTDAESARFPSMLSGGQQQRVAIARALGTPAGVILADEPTGNLDSENSMNIINLLKRLAREQEYCVIVVTHDPMMAESADVVLHMKDGRL